MKMNSPINLISQNSVTVNSAQNQASQSISKANNSPAFKGKVIEIRNPRYIKNIMKLGDDFNSAQQRAVSGVTGILIQPWFDLNNKRVDEETRVVSTARTLGKIVAGMATGVTIRWVLIKASEAFTKTIATEEARVKKAVEKGKNNYMPAKTCFKKWEQCLLPKESLNKSFREIKKYRLAFGTVAAVGVMLFTNFLIDAPLTTYLTNKFVKMFTGKDPAEYTKSKEKGGK